MSRHRRQQKRRMRCWILMPMVSVVIDSNVAEYGRQWCRAIGRRGFLKPTWWTERNLPWWDLEQANHYISAVKRRLTR